MSRTINIALCEARHQMPECVTGAIYPNTVDPLDIAGITKTADAFMRDHSGDVVNVYVTGLTICTVAIVKAALMALATEGAHPSTLTLWHFDRATGDYYPQTIISEEEKSAAGGVILYYAYN